MNYTTIIFYTRKLNNNEENAYHAKSLQPILFSIKI